MGKERCTKCVTTEIPPKILGCLSWGGTGHPGWCHLCPDENGRYKRVVTRTLREKLSGDPPVVITGGIGTTPTEGLLFERISGRR